MRENFARPAIACDRLRHYLPSALPAELDPAQLRISPNTFITETDCEPLLAWYERTLDARSLDEVLH